MAQGGPRARAGRLPDPNALRRAKDGKDWVALPRTPPRPIEPDWPAEIPEPTVPELAFWSTLWRKPQAIIWKIEGQEHHVALYVRTLIEAGEKYAPQSVRNAVRIMAADLMLTPDSLARARYWIVQEHEDHLVSTFDPAALAAMLATGTDGAKETKAATPRASRPGSGVRSRFTVVPSGDNPAPPPVNEDDDEPGTPEDA